MGIVAISSTHNNLIMFLQSSSCLFFQLFCSHCLHLCFQHDTFTTFTEVSVLWECHIWKMSIPNLAHCLLWYWWKIELLKSLIDLFNKEIWVYINGSSIKGADVPSYSTCCVWFSEKFELSMTILCNISMVSTVCARGLHLLVLPWIPLTGPYWKLCCKYRRCFEEYYVSCTMLSYK